MSKQTWSDKFRAALAVAASKAGVSLEGLQIEGCTIDNTWGDKVGLAFFGAAPEVNARAARFFEAWARKHLRAMGVVGGYGCQESINYVGPMFRATYPNGAGGWYRESYRERMGGEGATVVDGVAVSYVYYPCAD